MLQKLLNAYDWFDHPDGPKFVETLADAHRTCGHWLFLPGVFSSFHRVKNNEEIWALHSGKLLVHIIEPQGAYKLLKLGLDLDAGELPVVTVPTNYWQAAEAPAGVEFAFGTNVCAPGFSYDQFEIAERRDLLNEFPLHAEMIKKLTRTAET